MTIDGLTIANGTAVTGGGIGNAGILTLSNCTLSGNQSTGSSAAPTETSPEGGGAILNEPGATLTLENSALTDNIANAFNNTVDVFGGGLLNQGSATISSCTFSGNQATGAGGGSWFRRQRRRRPRQLWRRHADGHKQLVQRQPVARRRRLL